MGKNKETKKKKLVGKFRSPNQILSIADKKLMFEALLGRLVDAWIINVPYDKTYIKYNKALTIREKKVLKEFMNTFFPGEYEIY